MVLIALLLLSYLSLGDNKDKYLKGRERIAFYAVLLFELVRRTYSTVVQHLSWAEGGLSEYLTVSYQPGYFGFYALTRIWAPFLVALVFGLLVIFLFRWLNRRGDGKFFEKDEGYLAASVLLLLGYPGLLFYLLAVVLLYALWHLGNFVKGARDKRLPMYGLWPWVGIFTVLIVRYFIVGSPIWLLLSI